MSAAEAAPASSPKSASPKKAASPKKRAAGKPKAVASHPTYQAMIKAAITHLKETKGSSRAAILKYILQNYKVGDNVKLINARIRSALKRGVTAGALKQVKGTGASGSFRLGDKAKKVKKAAKPKKAKKATKPKSPKKAKSPKKPKSPKKAKSPKKPKTPKKAKTPKKPKAAKKSPAKKAAKPKKASPKKAVKA